MDIHVIILAAGFSRRFGGNKLLAELEGKPLYLHVVEKLLELQMLRPEIRSLMVVTQHQPIVDEMARRGIPVSWNDHSEDGISSSLQVGLESVTDRLRKDQRDWEGKESYFCFFVGDQPYLQNTTVESFFDGFRESGKGIGCLKWGARTGNPVIFSGRYLNELMGLKGDKGGKQVLHNHEEDVYYHEVLDSQELFDIDIRENLGKTGENKG